MQIGGIRSRFSALRRSPVESRCQSGCNVILIAMIAREGLPAGPGLGPRPAVPKSLSLGRKFPQTGARIPSAIPQEIAVSMHNSAILHSVINNLYTVSADL
jgi:hypothetical protein